MSNVIDSFLVALGFQTDTSGAEEYKKSLESVEKTVATVMGAAAAAAGIIGWAVHKAAASMGELYSFAELNEVSARSMEALGKIAVENDGSLEGMKSTVQSLNKVIGEAALGLGRGAMTFEKLNMSAKNADGSVKNVDDILSEVADKMQGLSRQEQLALGAKLGIDPQFVKVLAQGSENLKQLREEAELFNPFKEGDYELADKVDKLFIKASKSVGVFAKQIAVSMFPVIKQMLEGYLAWFKEFRKGGAENFGKVLKVIVAVLQTMWDWTVRVITAVKNFISWLTEFKIVVWASYAALTAFVAIKTYNFFMDAAKGVIGLTRTLLAFNATALFIPILIGAIIIAVALLIDEFVNFKEGNESFLGDLVKDYPQLLDVINKISDGVNAVISWVTNLFNELLPAFTDLGNALLRLFTALWPVVQFVFQAIGVIIMAVYPIVLWLATQIIILITWAIETAIGIVTWLVEAFATVVGAIATGISWVTNFLVSAWQLAVSAVSLSIGILVSLFTGAWDAIKASFTAVFDWISARIDSVVGAVKSAVEWVGKATGLGSVQIAASAQGGGAGTGLSTGAANTLASNGPIGVAAGPQQGGTSNITTTTTVNVPSIVVNSPDPTKAGQSVREELNKANRSSVRNGQSAVLL
jgi:phage-related protein